MLKRFPHLFSFLGLVLSFVVASDGISAAGPSGTIATPTSARSTAVEAHAIDGFLKRAVPLCRSQPARRCIDTGWRFIAAAPQKGLTVADLQSLQRRIGAWYAVHRAGLPVREL